MRQFVQFRNPDSTDLPSFIGQIMTTEIVLVIVPTMIGKRDSTGEFFFREFFTRVLSLEVDKVYTFSFT